ncbi:MAG: hypothetical protein JXQ90_22380 [Cyclobacteriaceae bacterium]
MKFELILVTLLIVIMVGCGNTENETQATKVTEEMTVNGIADSIRYFRSNGLQTDILSRRTEDLSRKGAYEIQLAMLDQEVKSGRKLIGWKMGGTATADTAKYDPTFGYILDSYLQKESGTMSSKMFPGGAIMMESEIGFVLKNDLPEGVTSIEELKSSIDYVVGAIELAQSTAKPLEGKALSPNHVVASGMGQVGTIKGSVQVAVDDFDFENETVKCYVNDSLVVEGIVSNIFGTPLNALFSLANLLPTEGKFLRAGDLVVTGSVYKNPLVSGAADVRVEFSSLGEIRFESQE